MYTVNVELLNLGYNFGWRRVLEQQFGYSLHKLGSMTSQNGDQLRAVQNLG